jgi:hypothetical protein
LLPEARERFQASTGRAPDARTFQPRQLPEVNGMAREVPGPPADPSAAAPAPATDGLGEAVTGPGSSPGTTGAPAVPGDPYSPEAVTARTQRPPYRANEAHNPRSGSFNPRKTPEPIDAPAVYETSSRGNMWTWYGKGQGGWYRYFSDNAGGVHFSGIVREAEVPTEIVRGAR